MNTSTDINRLRHIIYPAFGSLLFFCVALSPVTLLGCKLRGLLALTLALMSGIAGVFTGIRALKGRLKGDAKSYWWVTSTLILTIPVIAMIILA